MGDWDEPLADLVFHWGEAYLIDHPGPDTWLAQRRDDRTVLRAGTPAELLDLIREDYRVRPVARSPR